MDICTLILLVCSHVYLRYYPRLIRCSIPLNDSPIPLPCRTTRCRPPNKRPILKPFLEKKPQIGNPRRPERRGRPIEEKKRKINKYKSREKKTGRELLKNDPVLLGRNGRTRQAEVRIPYRPPPVRHRRLLHTIPPTWCVPSITISDKKSVDK